VIDPRFAILGAAISVLGSATYARETLRGRTEPNRVSWLMWTLAPLIAFAAELAQHVGLESLLTLAVGLGPLLVVLASFADPRAYARLTRLDIVCGALSLAALVAWGVTGTGDVAIAFSILSDLAAGIPTLRKAALAPHTENAVVFIGSAIGSIITLLTVGHWRLASFAFPAYIVAMDAALTTLILFPRPADPAAE
jgi:hypothetical protein